MKEKPEGISNEAYKALSELLFELSHATRLSILELVSARKSRHMEISKTLNISPQETTRHLERLLEVRIISKDIDGCFFPSPFGSLLLKMMPSLEFIVKNREYFMTHSLEELPAEFLARLFSLQEVQFGKRSLDGMFLARDMFLEAESYMNVLSHEVMQVSVPIVREKVLKGVRFKILLGKEAFSTLPEASLQEALQFRALDKIGTTLLMNERKALLCFPDLKGNPDYSYAFIGDDKDFHDFCHRLFFHFWKEASRV
jgi:predicted transcriptional regulator